MKLELLSSDPNMFNLQCRDAITLEDVAGVNPLETMLGKEFSRKQVLLNLERVTYIDSAAVSWFIHCHTACRNGGGRLVLHSIPPMVDQVLRLLRMHDLLNLASDEAAARAVAQGALP